MRGPSKNREVRFSLRGEIMEITITGRRMPITDPIRAYAEEKIGNSMKVMDINPLTAEVVLTPPPLSARLPCAHAATSSA